MTEKKIPGKAIYILELLRGIKELVYVVGTSQKLVPRTARKIIAMAFCYLRIGLLLCFAALLIHDVLNPVFVMGVMPR